MFVTVTDVKEKEIGIECSLVYNVFLAGWCAEAIGSRLGFPHGLHTRAYTHAHAHTNAYAYTDDDVFQEIQDMRMGKPAKNGIPAGQITGRSEIEMALYSALIEHEQHKQQRQRHQTKRIQTQMQTQTQIQPALVDRVASKYIEWFNTAPFVIEPAVTFALHHATNAADMVSNAIQHNADLDSNSVMMRCVPLAVMYMHRPPAHLMGLVAAEAHLTHPHPIVSLTAGLYCVVLSQLMLHKDQPDDNRSCESNEETNKEKELKDKVPVDACLRLLEHLLEQHAAHFPGTASVCHTIAGWIETGTHMTSLQEYDGDCNRGNNNDFHAFVNTKHAFVLVIFFLTHMDQHDDYMFAIIDVIKRGGDTGTNAKIVGNLFGAWFDHCVPLPLEQCVVSEHKYKNKRNHNHPFTTQHGMELIRQHLLLA